MAVVFRNINIICICFLAFLLIFSCAKNHPTLQSGRIKTENIVIIVMDGARYTETFGDSNKLYIPNLNNYFEDKGSLLTNFYNKGFTKTYSGHAAFLTGEYEQLDNTGLEIPMNPNIFQLYNMKNGYDSLSTMIVSSKDKLESLKSCMDKNWENLFIPFASCGIEGGGIGSGYRHDSITIKVALRLMQNNHPNLLLVSFREPDYSAHNRDWDGYLEGIRLVDKYIMELWKYIEGDNFFQGKTSMFVLNDHGRHLDSISDGFAFHGDDCEGCQHVFLFAIGPDFKSGVTINNEYDFLHFYSTLCYMMKLESPIDSHILIKEIFKDEILEGL